MAPAGIGSTRDAGGGATVLAGVTVEVVVHDVGTVGRPVVVDADERRRRRGSAGRRGAPVVGAVAARRILAARRQQRGRGGGGALLEQATAGECAHV